MNERDEMLSLGAPGLKKGYFFPCLLLLLLFNWKMSTFVSRGKGAFGGGREGPGEEGVDY